MKPEEEHPAKPVEPAHPKPVPLNPPRPAPPAPANLKGEELVIVGALLLAVVVFFTARRFRRRVVPANNPNGAKGNPSTQENLRNTRREETARTGVTGVESKGFELFGGEDSRDAIPPAGRGSVNEEPGEHTAAVRPELKRGEGENVMWNVLSSHWKSLLVLFAAGLIFLGVIPITGRIKNSRIVAGFIGLIVIWRIGIVLIRRLLARKLVLSEVAGVVRNFQSRTEAFGGGPGGTAAPDTIWTFKLERIDKQTGNQLVPVPVEMRGKNFIGFISEGDEVQLYDDWKEGTLCWTWRVRNLTNSVDVVALQARRGGIFAYISGN